MYHSKITALIVVLLLAAAMLAAPAQASPIGCTWEGKYGLVCCHAGTGSCR